MKMDVATLRFSAELDITQFNAAANQVIQRLQQINDIVRQLGRDRVAVSMNLPNPQTIQNAANAVNNLSNNMAAAAKSADNLSQGTFSLAAIFIRWAMIQHAVMNVTLTLRTAFESIARLGTAMAKPAIEFERMLAMVDTIARYTPSAMDKVRSSILELSRSTIRSTDELARGLYDIVSAMGATGDELRILEQANKDAIAGFTNLQTASKALAIVLNVYGDQLIDVSQASDIMFAMVDKAIAPYEELAQVIGVVVNQAKIAGQSFATAAGALAFLNKVGIDANRSATYLNQLFRQLTERADNFKKVLGIDVRTKEGGFRDLLDIMTELHDKVAELAPFARMEVLRKIFPDVRELMAVQAIIGSFELFKETMLDVRNSAGEAEAAFERAISRPGHKLEIFINQIKTLKTEIGTELVKSIEHILEVLSPVLQGFLDMSSTGKRLASELTIVSGAFMGLGTAIGYAMWGYVKLQAAIKILQKVLSVEEAAAMGLTRFASIARFVFSGWSALILAVVVALGYLYVKLRDTKARIEENKRAVIEHAESLKREAVEAHELLARYNELSSRHRQTQAEKEDLNRVSKKLVELLPELNWQLDEEGRIMISTADAAAALKEKISELTQAEKERLTVQHQAVMEAGTRLIDLREHVREFIAGVKGKPTSKIPMPPAMIPWLSPGVPPPYQYIPKPPPGTISIHKILDDLHSFRRELDEIYKHQVTPVISAKDYQNAKLAIDDLERRIGKLKKSAEGSLVPESELKNLQKAMDNIVTNLEKRGARISRRLWELTPEKVEQEVEKLRKKLEQKPLPSAPMPPSTVEAETDLRKKGEEQLKALREQYNKIKAIREMALATGRGEYLDTKKVSADLLALYNQSLDRRKYGLALQYQEVEMLNLQAQILQDIIGYTKERNQEVTEGAERALRKWQDMAALGRISEEELINRIRARIDALKEIINLGIPPQGVRMEDIYSTTVQLLNTLKQIEEKRVETSLTPAKKYIQNLERLTRRAEDIEDRPERIRTIDEIRKAYGEFEDQLVSLAKQYRNTIIELDKKGLSELTADEASDYRMAVKAVDDIQLLLGDIEDKRRRLAQELKILRDEELKEQQEKINAVLEASENIRNKIRQIHEMIRNEIRETIALQREAFGGQIEALGKEYYIPPREAVEKALSQLKETGDLVKMIERIKVLTGEIAENPSWWEMFPERAQYLFEGRAAVQLFNLLSKQRELLKTIGPLPAELNAETIARLKKQRPELTELIDWYVELENSITSVLEDIIRRRDAWLQRDYQEYQQQLEAMEKEREREKERDKEEDRRVREVIEKEREKAREWREYRLREEERARNERIRQNEEANRILREMEESRIRDFLNNLEQSLDEEKDIYRKAYLAIRQDPVLREFWIWRGREAIKAIEEEQRRILQLITKDPTVKLFQWGKGPIPEETIQIWKSLYSDQSELIDQFIELDRKRIELENEGLRNAFDFISGVIEARYKTFRRTLEDTLNAPVRTALTVADILRNKQIEGFWQGYSQNAIAALNMIAVKQQQLLEEIGGAAPQQLTESDIFLWKYAKKEYAKQIDMYVDLEELKTKILTDEEERRYELTRRNLENYVDWAYGMWADFLDNIFQMQLEEGIVGLSRTVTEAMIKTSPIYKHIMAQLTAETEKLVPPEEALRIAITEAGRTAAQSMEQAIVQGGQQAAVLLKEAQTQTAGLAPTGATAAVPYTPGRYVNPSNPYQTSNTPIPGWTDTKTGVIVPVTGAVLQAPTQQTTAAVQTPAEIVTGQREGTAKSRQKAAISRLNWFNSLMAAYNIFTSAQGVSELAGGLGGAATGFMLGGPVGAAVGGLIGWFSARSSRRKRRKQKWDELLGRYFETPEIPYAAPQFLPFGALVGGMSPELAFHGGFAPYSSWMVGAGTGGGQGSTVPHSDFFNTQRGSVVVNNVNYYDFSGNREQLAPTDWRKITRTIAQQRSNDSLRPDSSEFAFSSRAFIGAG